MPLFQNSVVTKYLNSQNKETIAEKWNIYQNHFLNTNIQENIRNSKEEQYQEGFLRDLFVNVLGYTLNPDTNFNLTTELKNIKDSKKADGGIIINEKVIGVIELKGTNTTDLSKIESQAFGYKNNQSECVYVISSNFEKLRFYIDNAIEFIEFNLFLLKQKEFELLYLCLAYSNIEKNIAKKIKDESLSQEDIITKKLYKDYSLFKRELYNNLTELNPQFDQLELFKKSQKLLDRFLFLFFAEDRQLLPPNSVRLILNDWKELQERDAYIPLYDRFKKYFEYLNIGYKGKRYDVFAYNGGLFKPDEVLDNIKINDEILYKHTLNISDYDFVSEVDVNILGHIFENSLNELDEIKAELEGQQIDKTKTKRKKDGVFYTPKYITKYIVENTVGKLCSEKKEELKIVEEEYYTDKKINKTNKQALLNKLEEYRKWLLQITICDPACGSGAFLNEALNFLIKEHGYIDELQAKLFGDAILLSDVEKSILENNLFGVDLNEESVEIAKLSLWLRTAQPNRKLNDLNNNIKCGNSLIDDPAVAGDKAFNWQNQFPQVFAKGGFDVVIGNPPYGATLNENEKTFIEKTFTTFEYQVNTYVIFYEKSIDILKNNGLLGFITPATFTYQHYFKKIRLFFQNYKQIAINKYCYEVFEDADIGDSVSWIISKTKNDFSDIILQTSKSKEDLMMNLSLKEYKSIISSDFTYNLSDFIININKFSNSKFVSLDIIASIIVGVKPYQTGKGYPKQTPEDVVIKKYTSTIKKDETYINCIIGKDFQRYLFTNKPEMYLSYGKWLAEPRESAPFFEDKIIIRQTSDSLICNIDFDKRINLNNVYNIGIKDENFRLKYLLSILNSKLLNYLYQNISQEKGRLFAEVKKINLAKLPVCKVETQDQQPFIDKADLMLSLNKDLQELSQKVEKNIQREFSLEELPNKLKNWYELSYLEFLKELEKKKIKPTLSQKAEWEEYFLTESKKALELKQQINETDKEIDQMVYKLYELTEEEIRIVEGVK